MNFPRHKCGLYLTHNQHRDYYQGLAEYLEETKERDYWADPQDRESAIATGELWELQWYPDTPVGFIVIRASTLERLLAFAEKIEQDDINT